MIKLLIVDDSALMRRLLGSVFSGRHDFEVTTARNGVEALAKLDEVGPDVVTLDVHMPDMDGLACLDRIMVERPCPVVMVSSLTGAGANVTLEALELGAVDFIAKPDGAISLAMDEFAPLLMEKVRSAARARIRCTTRLADRVRLRSGAKPRPPSPPIRRHPILSAVGTVTIETGPTDGIVVVGSSTGGPPALDALLSRLPADFPWPLIVAQHMPATFTGPLARRLDKLCALTVSEVVRPVPVEPGHVYIGRGDGDIIVSMRGGAPVVMPAPPSREHRWHPSVDRLVTSAMQHLGPERMTGILMTGMGNDGAASMTRLRETGGRTIAEAEETAVVWGMPGELVRAGGAQIVAPVDEIADRLLELVP